VHVPARGSAAVAFFGLLVPYFELGKVQARQSLFKSFPSLDNSGFESLWKSSARFKRDFKELSGLSNRPRFCSAPTGGPACAHKEVVKHPSISSRPIYSERRMLVKANSIAKARLKEVRREDKLKQQRFVNAFTAIKRYAIPCDFFRCRSSVHDVSSACFILHSRPLTTVGHGPVEKRLETTSSARGLVTRLV
jgi:hypothetical protein